ncbi:MAG: hypothetical protein ACRD1K_15410 [Acidimicrobiales bacterium]
MSTIAFARATWDYLAARLRLDERRQAGMTTTEIAVITFLLVGAAIVVMGVIFTAAKNNAQNIPDPKAPTGP